MVSTEEHIIVRGNYSFDTNSLGHKTSPVVGVNSACQFQRHIFYLKIHKTGSSTMNTLLGRMILKYDLKQVPVRNYGFPGTGPVALALNPPQNATPLGPYDVLSDHTFYSAHIENMMPPDTKYIASIRFPLRHLRAMFDEFRIGRILGITTPDPITTFLENIPKYGSRSILTRNVHALYFGLQVAQFDDQIAIQNLISFIDERYSSIIVMEYFVESLVLLRRRMCWPISDMVYLIQRENKFTKTKNAMIPWQARQAHHNNSYADYAIYNFLTNKMLREMELQNYFWEEVDTLKRITKTLAGFCQPFLDQLKVNTRSIYEIEKRNDSITFNPEPWGDPFTIFSVDCAIMKMDTVVFRNNVKVRQMPELCTSPSIKRQWQTGSLYINIQWDGGAVTLHKSYCQDMHPRFKIPMAVLADKTAYMWLWTWNDGDPFTINSGAHPWMKIYGFLHVISILIVPRKIYVGIYLI